MSYLEYIGVNNKFPINANCTKSKEYLLTDGISSSDIALELYEGQVLPLILCSGKLAFRVSYSSNFGVRSRLPIWAN